MPGAGAAAARLIAEFGSFSAAIAGSLRRQRHALGDDRAAIGALRGFHAAMLYALRGGLADRPLLDDWRRLLDYLAASMVHCPVEHFRVLHLDARNKLIHDEIASHGTIDHAVVHVRELMHRALDLGTAAMILVHNHPGRSQGPSSGDIALTRRVVEVANRLDIVVHDHLIIAGEGHCSMRSLGLL